MLSRTLRQGGRRGTPQQHAPSQLPFAGFWGCHTSCSLRRVQSGCCSLGGAEQNSPSRPPVCGCVRVCGARRGRYHPEGHRAVKIILHHKSARLLHAGEEERRARPCDGAHDVFPRAGSPRAEAAAAPPGVSPQAGGSDGRLTPSGAEARVGSRAGITTPSGGLRCPRAMTADLRSSERGFCRTGGALHQHGLPRPRKGSFDSCSTRADSQPLGQGQLQKH